MVEKSASTAHVVVLWETRGAATEFGDFAPLIVCDRSSCGRRRCVGPPASPCLVPRGPL